MAKTVFDFHDYRAYLADALPTIGEKRGGRVRLAQSLRIQKAFVSSVLHGDAHFSLEQAIQVSEFLEHLEAERDFFLLLVQLTRAGSKALEGHFRAKIDAILRQRRKISERIDARAGLSEGDRLTYYSSWHYTAVHMCLMVPRLRTAENMARYLGLPLPAVRRILEFLVLAGLATQTGSVYGATQTRLHLPADSPLVHKHHVNWRMQAIQSLDRSAPTNLHYSLVMSISEEAAEKIRAILLGAIQQCEPVVKEAKDERVVSLCLDLFDLGI